jgi:hypothetical protein
VTQILEHTQQWRTVGTRLGFSRAEIEFTAAAYTHAEGAPLNYRGWIRGATCQSRLRSPYGDEIANPQTPDR